MRRRVVILVLTALVLGGVLYRVIRKQVNRADVAQVPQQPVQVPQEPVPDVIAPTLVSLGASTQAILEPFVELFEPDPETLLEWNLDDAGIDRLRERKQSDWVDVTLYSAIACEVTTRESHFGYLGIRWKMDGRETTAQKKLVFHWPYSLPPERAGAQVTNRYDHIPVPPGASAGCADFEFYRPENFRNIAKVRILGYRTTTTGTKNTPIISEQSASATGRCLKLEFPAPSAQELHGRVHGAGARLCLHGVSDVRVVTRDHRTYSLDKPAEWTLGSFLPHQILFKNAAGESCGVSVNQAELVHLRYNPTARTLRLKAYYYHFAERYVTNHEEDVRFSAKQAAGWRHHFNKGAATSLPAATITLGLGRADAVFAPLWQPQGRLATFIFVEHADYQETESDMFLMYGNAAKEIQPGVGMIGNRLPLTKTIFLVGPKGNFVKRINGVPLTFEPVSFLGDQTWRDLLLHYQAAQVPVEFGAHTPGRGSMSKADNQLAMRELTGLGGRVWTDHGSVLANMSRNGWNERDDTNFMLRLLRSNGVCYINALNETYTAKGEIAVSQLFDNAPSNLLFSIPPTNSLAVNDNTPFLFTTLWDGGAPLRQVNRDRLNTFVQNRSIVLSHCYLATDCLDFQVDADGNRVMALAPEANRAMQALAKCRDDGDLHITTVGTWADYVRGIRALIILREGSEITIANPGKDLKDVSFMFRCLDPKGIPVHLIFDGKEITNMRHIGDMTYFYTDVLHGKHTLNRVPK